MIVDGFVRVATAQTVTATAVSDNSVNLRTIRDIGVGCELFAVFTTTETVTAGGAATVTFEVIGATDAALTAGIVVLAASKAIGKASLVADPTGKLNAAATPIILKLPVDIGDLQALYTQYIGARFTIATGPLSTGKFNADFVQNYQDGRRNYASGFAIL